MFGFFSRKKVKKQVSDVPWRTADGTYKCQSEICPPDLCGSERCPLDLQTTALFVMNGGYVKEAIEYMQKALKIAPDFPQGWCNLGALYGNIGEHALARDAFKKALLYKPDYKLAIDGLKTAKSHLEDDDGQINHLDILLTLIECATKHGDLPEKGFKYVPELLPYADDIAKKIMHGIDTDARSKKLVTDFAKKLQIVITWSLFAGIGAVLEWERNQDKLIAAGVYEKLCETRGGFAMDEYVIGLFCGEEYNTERGITPKKSEEFNARIHIYVFLVRSIFGKELQKVPDQKKEQYIVDSLPELSKALYLFGMTYALANTEKD